MFRKPREEETDQRNPVLLGRPPTPPGTPAKTPFTLAVPPRVPAPTMAIPKSKSSTRQAPLPVIGRQGPTGRKTAATPKNKQSGKPNSSILSFFKKAEDGSNEADGLFFKERGQRSTRALSGGDLGDEPSEEGFNVDADDLRYNENQGSIKKRRTSTGSQSGTDDASLFGESPMKPVTAPTISRHRSGPFLEESDSEQEEENPQAIIAVTGAEDGTKDMRATNGKVDELLKADPPNVVACETVSTSTSGNLAERVIDTGTADRSCESPNLPLLREETSLNQEFDEFRDFEGAEDFDEDLFEEGDEFRERRYMEEQAKIETESSITPTCPICDGIMAGLSEQEAGVHVNQCLDGTPSALAKLETSTVATSTSTVAESTVSPAKAASPGSQFKRTPRPPKPGQASPFVLGQASISGGSAFSKLMSGHAEDAAWAEAAAAEHAARGKPAYQRTCPFYKILPGLLICVDAFRYGAVANCQAYFLSHFHSDHYVGLTSSWCHGPIYCSRVTANLVRQQLRVDPKYVVDLEFEQPFEVPGTKGVTVTMISANHCPGSSLYLFEKTVGKRPNGEPKLQRILHCGDFRACRKHLEHPLLIPQVRDTISGKTRDQKIDVCYLDTTYLNPKYAFPSQELVIKACADMCVSLSKHSVDESDGWEQMKRQRAGEGMVKFVRKDSTDQKVKEEPNEDEDGVDSNGIKLEKNPHDSQQILSSIKTQNSRGRLLVIVGTYSIGKERICLGIAKALNSKIYAPPGKQRIVAALEDPELNERMTSDPRAAQVHMTPLFEIRAETLDDYLKDYFPHFTRAVGFRPSGWNYRPPNTRFLESPSVQTVLNGDNWKSQYSMRDLVPQRGSSSRASCFGVPYSEHSSFRELTMFCCALHIEKIIPTVNVGSAKSREKMKAWCERWMQERRKNGLWALPSDGSW